MYPNQTIDDVVSAVYTFVTTAYSLTPDTLEEQNIKQSIYALINGYLNYQLSYSPEQMNFINKLIGGVLTCGNPEDILPFITDIEEEIAKSGLTATNQMPLLIAASVGKAAYTYWSAVVTTPALWSNFTTSFTPAIVKFPFWVASSMQGVLIGLNILNVPGQFADIIKILTDANGFEIIMSLLGSLTICTGKVVFNWQQQFSN